MTAALLLERIRAALADRDDVVEKRMVGGRSFMVGRHLCCGLFGDDLMVRVGPNGVARAIEQPGVRPMRFGERPLKGYVLVDSPAVASDASLRQWLDRSITFVETLGQ